MSKKLLFTPMESLNDVCSIIEAYMAENPEETVTAQCNTPLEALLGELRERLLHFSNLILETDDLSLSKFFERVGLIYTNVGFYWPIALEMFYKAQFMARGYELDDLKVRYMNLANKIVPVNGEWQVEYNYSAAHFIIAKTSVFPKLLVQKESGKRYTTDELPELG